MSTEVSPEPMVKLPPISESSNKFGSTKAQNLPYKLGSANSTTMPALSRSTKSSGNMYKFKNDKNLRQSTLPDPGESRMPPKPGSIG